MISSLNVMGIGDKMKFQKVSSEKRFFATLPVLNRLIPKEEQYKVSVKLLCSIEEATYLLKNFRELAAEGVSKSA